ncbi:MAG: hypothetical protein HLX50_01900 [Alteromonadaceae bacterium]|nr:hypothetical protein [Alteromonadaceae bacterium]
MENFTLDGKRYQIPDLPEEAQKLARQTIMTSDLIQKLEARASIARTAQARYLNRLKTILDEAPAGTNKQ